MSLVIQGRLFRELVNFGRYRGYEFSDVVVKLGPVFLNCVFLMVCKELIAKGGSFLLQGFPVCPLPNGYFSLRLLVELGSDCRVNNNDPVMV